jgi:hypothetical protein
LAAGGGDGFGLALFVNPRVSAVNIVVDSGVRSPLWYETGGMVGEVAINIQKKR